MGRIDTLGIDDVMERLNFSQIPELLTAGGSLQVQQWTAPRSMHYISFALHFICITFALHLKILPCQYKMHDMS